MDIKRPKHVISFTELRLKDDTYSKTQWQSIGARAIFNGFSECMVDYRANKPIWVDLKKVDQWKKTYTRPKYGEWSTRSKLNLEKLYSSPL